MARTLGVDFGTSNTAAAVVVDGRPQVISLEPGRDSVPTAVFLDYAARAMVFGTGAVEALVEGREGRFMRALKRVLGTPLMREQRQLLNRRMSLMEVVAEFLSQVKASAEAETGQVYDRALSGRPVRFHLADPERDRAAEADLAECYRMAGFAEAEFLFEPEAAALASGVTDGVGLVVDIGGGTSDFTVFRAADGRHEVLASHGVRIGGTDFDRALSLAHVMPLFGMGTDLKAEFGPDRHEAPVALFHDLATWEKIAFLQGAEARRDAARMAKRAVAPKRFGRLVAVLEHELGHDVAFAVEAGKIAANGGLGRIDLAEVEPGLSLPLSEGALTRDLAGFATEIGGGARAALAAAGLPAGAVDHVVLVGGSSLLGAIGAEMSRLCPQAAQVRSAAFTAVAEGLALAAAERDAADARS